MPNKKTRILGLFLKYVYKIKQKNLHHYSENLDLHWKNMFKLQICISAIFFAFVVKIFCTININLLILIFIQFTN